MESEGAPTTSGGSGSLDPDSMPSNGGGGEGRRRRSRRSSLSESEAEIDRNVLFPDEDEAVDEEEEEGEDLFPDNFMEQDYRPLEGQDQYEPVGLDDEVSDERDFATIMADRNAADMELDERDGLLNNDHRGRKLPSILRERDEDEDDEYRPVRQRIRVHEPLTSSPIAATSYHDDEPEEDEEEEDTTDFLNVQGNSIPEWVARDEVRRFIQRKFRHFLETFSSREDENRPDYREVVDNMVAANRCSLELNYNHWLNTRPELAIWLADAPQALLEIMEEGALQFVHKHHPNYNKIHEKIHLRITHLPLEDKIRNIRQIHLDTLLKISGVVTRRSGVFPQLQQVKYDCSKCGTILGPFFQNTQTEIKVGSCPECQSRGPFTVNVEQTIYRNYQKLTLQESPNTVQAGRLPRYKEIILLHDLIDCARPGEEIEVTGIYVNNFDSALNTKNGFPVFATVVEANYVSKKQDLFAAYKLTDEDKAEIEKYAKDPRIGQKIIKSIAPSIYGHEDIKTAIALAMFGGQEKNVQGKHRLRGDINVLLLGDPGTAKSQFLKYIEKTAQRAVYTTGKGASAVGLTAAVHKDPVTREWTLEGGALVLADRGICLIDEFDKMNDQDRVSIHEAMEQQSISISKAGIVTSLQARCSVIAAANPVGGRYDSGKTFAQNVELTDPILSRFDVLRVVKDVVDPVMDEMLATFVVDSHFKSHPRANHVEEETRTRDESADKEILSQAMLRKYITYAKMHSNPKLRESDLEKVALVYADLRRESMHGQGVPIAVRHIESMIRMAEAHARMHLRNTVIEDDVDMAIRVMLESFISTQKFGVQKALQKSFKKYITYKRDFNELLLHLLRGLVADAIRFEELVSRMPVRLNQVEIKMEDLESKAQEYGIIDLQPFYDSQQFAAANFTLDTAHGIIRHIMNCNTDRQADLL
jgi:DNA replication licensing factor MCM2